MQTRKPAPAKLEDLASSARTIDPATAEAVKGGITDGTSNTIMFAEATPRAPQPRR